jgi:hypothetical protein
MAWYSLINNKEALINYLKISINKIKRKVALKISKKPSLKQLIHHFTLSLEHIQNIFKTILPTS